MLEANSKSTDAQSMDGTSSRARDLLQPNKNILVNETNNGDAQDNQVRLLRPRCPVRT